MLTDERISQIIDLVQDDWGVGGLDTSTMYGEFAMEVAKRAISENENHSPALKVYDTMDDAISDIKPNEMVFVVDDKFTGFVFGRPITGFFQSKST